MVCAAIPSTCTSTKKPLSDAPQYGLIGYPLSHSFSPAYFAEKFAREGISGRYDAFPLQRIEDFPALLSGHPQLRGLNVTIPYKEAVIPYLDSLHLHAEKIGAVNCILFKDGKLIGCNTDWAGFSDSLTPRLAAHHTRALVLGTGGASKAVCYALQRLGVSFRKVSRHPQKSVLDYASLTAEMIEETPIIINTTPLGMHPEILGLPPIPYEAIGPQHLLYDLVYNPALTRFLEEGKKSGAWILNGQEMLERQAEYSWRIWQGEAP